MPPRTESNQEKETGVIELHGDDPTTLGRMLQYVYTQVFPIDPPVWLLSSPSSFMQPGLLDHWLEHVELAIVADKYGFTSLFKEIVERMEKLPVPNSSREVQVFFQRLPTSPLGCEHVNAFLSMLCNRLIRSSFLFTIMLTQPDFLDFLQHLPQLQEQLCVHWFVKAEAMLLGSRAFRKILQSNGSLALKCMDALCASRERTRGTC